jgi:hypothetical protein
MNIFADDLLKFNRYFLYIPWGFLPVMPKALEGWPNMAARLAGWRRVTWQVCFCTRWKDHTACLFRTVPVALTGAAQLRADGISSCCYTVNVPNHPSWGTSHKEGTVWYSSRPMPSLWFSQFFDDLLLTKYRFMTASMELISNAENTFSNLLQRF